MKNVFRRRTPFRVIALGLSLVYLGGCAGLPGNDDAFSQGWRRAKVVSLNMPNALPGGAHYECQGEAGSSALPGSLAIASYGVAGSPNVRNLRAVAVPGDAELKVGDTVLINVRSCQVSLRKVAVSANS